MPTKAHLQFASFQGFTAIVEVKIVDQLHSLKNLTEKITSDPFWD
jgi:hypothetical protein